MKLSNLQIDKICQAILDHTEKYDLYSFMVFETLYNTGLRINELIDYSRISLVDANTALVKTQKYSNPRIIHISSINQTYFENYITNNLHKFIRSYSYYSSKIIAFNNEFGNLYVDGKQITTHLFRHNFVKKLSDSGLSVPEISSIIGERVDKNTLGYIHSQISSIK
ncbi:MAG: site-specific integrase [Bacteroidales bacterium]